MSLEAQIEAILFAEAEPFATARLAKVLGRSEAEIKAALANLAASLGERGIQLVQDKDEVTLATHPAAAEILAKLRQEELSRELGKAALETLSVVIYRAPVARGDVDYIRGVNSSYILRHLLIRGLVERITNPGDARSYLYQPTLALLQHLGLRQWSELPEYESVRSNLHVA